MAPLTYTTASTSVFCIAEGVQHDGRLPFWKPASVFARYVRTVIVFAIGEINILLLLLLLLHCCLIDLLPGPFVDDF